MVLMTTTINKKNYAWLEGKVIYLNSKFSLDLVNDVRIIKGRQWDAHNKLNSFPLSSIDEFREFASKWGIELAPELMSAERYETGPLGEGMKQLELDGDKVRISFEYSPEMITSVRAFIPSARWSIKERVWLAPLNDIMQVMRFAFQFRLTMSQEVVDVAREITERANKLREASEALHGEVHIEDIAIPLLPYQQAGVSYIKTVRKGIIGDQPGLGKTAQAIATVASERAFPAVVVCPNTLKINWQREIKKFFPKIRVSILTGGKSVEIEESDVIVVNYDILYNRNDDIIQHGFKSLIVDESHAIKNGQKKHVCPECGSAVRSNSVNCGGCGSRGISPMETWTVKRTAAVMRLAKMLGPDDFTILLTGTPITNRPDELIPQLEAIGRLDHFGGAWKFKNRYAPQRNTALNTQELNNKLREMCFVRRNKSDVYGELPPLRNAVQYLSIDEKLMKDYKTVEADAVEYFAQKAREIAEEEGSDGTSAYWEKKIALDNARNLIRITALRDSVSKIKLSAVTEWLDNFLESSEDEKVIVFAEHIAMVEALFDRYKEVAVKIRGGVSVEDRQKAVDSFQNDPKCRVFVANMTSASEGLTLTAASDVVFCELGWTPAIHEQCVSRCYGRINDMHGATAWYLLAPQTIDEDIYGLLENKRKIVNAVTDGEDVVDDGSLITDLVKTLAGRGMNK